MSKSVEEAREECRHVGKGIEELVESGGDLLEAFEGSVPALRFKIVKDGRETHVVGGEIFGDDSHLVISEAGVWKAWGDGIVGYAFPVETQAAMRDFFRTLYTA